MTIYVDTREGPAPTAVPAEIVERLRVAASDETRLEHGLVVAALVIVRLGREAGEALLRHWLAYNPALLWGADPRLLETLAFQPELVIGSLVQARSSS